MNKNGIKYICTLLFVQPLEHLVPRHKTNIAKLIEIDLITQRLFKTVKTDKLNEKDTNRIEKTVEKICDAVIEFRTKFLPVFTIEKIAH